MKPGRRRQKNAHTSSQPAIQAAGGRGEKVKPLLPLRHETHLARLPQQPLMPFDATGRLRAAIPFGLEDYLDLVEATGRCQHPGKRGKMPERAPRLLQRLQLEPEQFVECSARLMLRFGSAVGASENLTAHCAARQVKYLRGMGAARKMAQKRVA